MNSLLSIPFLISLVVFIGACPKAEAISIAKSALLEPAANTISEEQLIEGTTCELFLMIFYIFEKVIYNYN
jgi:hypothetical protein